MTSEAGESGVIYSQPFNYRISPRMRARLDKQADRLDITVTSVARFVMALGLEALEGLEADAAGRIPDEGGEGPSS